MISYIRESFSRIPNWDSCLIGIDIVADFIPCASTVSNFVAIILKVGIDQSVLSYTDNDYYSYLNDKSYADCCCLLIPLFGNYWIRWYNVKNIFCDQLESPVEMPQIVVSCLDVLTLTFSSVLDPILSLKCSVCSYFDANENTETSTSSDDSTSLYDGVSETSLVETGYCTPPRMNQEPWVNRERFSDLVAEAASSPNRRLFIEDLWREGRNIKEQDRENFLIEVGSEWIFNSSPQRNDDFLSDPSQEQEYALVERPLTNIEPAVSLENDFDWREFLILLLTLKFFSTFASLVESKKKPSSFERLLDGCEQGIENGEGEQCSIEDIFTDPSSVPLKEEVENREESNKMKFDALEDIFSCSDPLRSEGADPLSSKEDWLALVDGFLHELGYQEGELFTRMRARIIEKSIIKIIVNSKKPARKLKDNPELIALCESKEEFFSRLILTLDQEEHKDFSRYENGEKSIVQFLTEAGVMDPVFVQKVKKTLDQMLKKGEELL